jgi:orotidine-5'-phosphate decarboxylase
MSLSYLKALIKTKKAPICVGLDPQPQYIPLEMLQAHNFDVAETYHEYLCRVIDEVADLVPAVKPQSAFFEQFGVRGARVLSDICRYANEKGLYVILDVKRGDIDHTATAYAAAYLSHDNDYFADAITINPYLGTDGIKPFLAQAQKSDKAIFALVKTSNPSSGEVQDIKTETGESVYMRVAELLHKLDPSGDYLGFVVGATYPAQIESLRASFPNTFFLVPGFGTQGGAAADVAPAFTVHGENAIINSSRGIIADKSPRDAVLRMRLELSEVVAF